MAQRPVALVTGARRGIGAAIAIELARQGFDLALTDAMDEAADTVARCGAAGAQAWFRRHDSADIAAHPALIEAIFERFGSLDTVVNSAGIGAPVRGDLLDLEPANFDRVIDVNLRGAVFLCQAAARRMVAQKAAGRRCIILVSSVSAEMASPERADYCISKAGLSMFARVLALRLAAEDIAVFELRPGIIRTEMTAPVAGRYDDAIASGLVPMRRWGEPGDVAQAVAALAGGQLHFATGSVIACDGGLSIHRL